MKANDLAARLVQELSVHIRGVNLALQDTFTAIERNFERAPVLEYLNEKAFDLLTRRRLAESFRDLLLIPPRAPNLLLGE